MTDTDGQIVVHPQGYLVKMVRDSIPDLLEATSTELATVEYHPMPHDQHVKELRKKLAEECGEYLVDPCLSELADVLAVVFALAAVDLGVLPTDVVAKEQMKRNVRGGFALGMGMYATHPADLVKWPDNPEAP